MLTSFCIPTMSHCFQRLVKLIVCYWISLKLAKVSLLETWDLWILASLLGLQSRDRKPYFQKFNLRRKADRNFRGTFLKNFFRRLKLYSNPPSWLARSHCHMGIFWKTKNWSSLFWESQPFRFWYMEVHCQRRLKLMKTGISS